MKKSSFIALTLILVYVQTAHTRKLSEIRTHLPRRTEYGHGKLSTAIFVYNNSSVPLNLSGMTNVRGGICLYRPQNPAQAMQLKGDQYGRQGALPTIINKKDWICQKHTDGGVQIASGEIVGLVGWDKYSPTSFSLWAIGDKESWTRPQVRHKGHITKLDKDGSWIFTDHGVFFDKLPELGDRAINT